MTIFDMLRRLSGTRPADGPDPTRRALLAGFGAVVAAATLAPLALPAGRAQAAMPLQSFPDDGGDAGGTALDNLATDRLEGSEAPQLAQSNRWRRRQLLRRCRRDRRFRRDNRRLCRRVENAVGRPGACVQVGPVTICE
jgi:hypothetical protein